jgi:hypothetical protein
MNASASPTSSAASSSSDAHVAAPLALYSFCGVWTEVPSEGDSLEPILRRLGLSDKKIEATLRGGTKQKVSLHGWELSTTYESELGSTKDVHVVNGGRRALAQNAGLTECRFEASAGARRLVANAGVRW